MMVDRVGDLGVLGVLGVFGELGVTGGDGLKSIVVGFSMVLVD